MMFVSRILTTQRVEAGVNGFSIKKISSSILHKYDPTEPEELSDDELTSIAGDYWPGDREDDPILVEKTGTCSSFLY